MGAGKAHPMLAADSRQHRSMLCDDLYHLAQHAVRADRRDLLPVIEMAFWLLHHVCDELAAVTERQSSRQPADGQ